MRLTWLLTNTPPGGPATNSLTWNYAIAAVEDRIRTGKDTGLRNLPFYDSPQPNLGRDRRPAPRRTSTVRTHADQPTTLRASRTAQTGVLRADVLLRAQARGSSQCTES
jgi:hypothetical protein